MSKKGYLLLEDGQLLEGELHGAEKSAMAELVFTTAMVGYMETLTDPSYNGQIVIQPELITSRVAAMNSRNNLGSR